MYRVPPPSDDVYADNWLHEMDRVTVAGQIRTLVETGQITESGLKKARERYGDEFVDEILASVDDAGE